MLCGEKLYQEVILVDAEGINQNHLFASVISIDMRHGAKRRKIMGGWNLTPKLLFHRRREFIVATHNVF